MPPLIKADRVKETTTTTGYGSFTLDGAVAGYKAFSSVMATDDICFYTAINPTTNEWECGWGTFTAPNTLSRVALSYSNGFFGVFGAGTKEVFISVTARQMAVGEFPNPTGVGSSANLYMTTGSSGALRFSVYSANFNIMIGNNPFNQAAKTGNTASNIGIGISSLNNIGSHSSIIATSSNNNIAIGTQSATGIRYGVSNICIGAFAGASDLIEYGLLKCILIGAYAMTSGTSDSNSIVIGADAVGNGSNTTTIGHTTITDCYIRGHLHPSGAVRPASIADSSAPTNAIYYSTTAGKLVYKDSSGVVNNLY